MSKPKGKKSAGTSEARGPAAVAVSLATARKMLPLVGRIVNDIQTHWKRLAKLEAEQGDLERRRRVLSWPERNRRYLLADEISDEQHYLQDAMAELEVLQIVMVDPAAAEVAFPAVINGRRGYFVWKAGEDDVTWWCYAHDAIRHKIPPTWLASAK